MFTRRHHRTLASVTRTVGSVLTAAVLVGGVVTLSSGVSAAADSSPGITAKTIDLGYLSDVTSFGATSTGLSVMGFKARIAAQNAAGGVDGRKIIYQIGDTQSSPASSLTAAQLLATQDKVFAIGSFSFATFGAEPFLTKAGVPFIGAADYDGGTWTKAQTNMISMVGSQNTEYNPANSAILGDFKKDGITKVAYLTYSNQAAVVKGNLALAYAAKKLGITLTLVPITLGAIPNITSLDLSIRNSGATGLYAGVLPNYTYSVLTGLKQAGYNLKKVISVSGQGQPLLDDPSALTAAQGVYFLSEINTTSPGYAQLRAALKKYENYTGVPDLNIPYGWLAASLMIQGLQGAGKNPTRASFLKATKAIKAFSANGLQYPAINISADTDAKALGAPGFCEQSLLLQGKKFIPKGPVCGKLVTGFGGL